MGKSRRKRIQCPNCETQLQEHMNFCYECGQENHIKRVSMKMLSNDFFSTYFSADSKLFKSLKHLITKPSFLSLEYLNGRIEAYLRPIRLYIFISFAYFLLLNITSPVTELKGITINDSTEKTVSNETAEKDTNQLELGEEFNEKINKIFSDKKESVLFFTYVRSKLPILLFIIIPVFAGLLFLCFYKKNYYYVDHLVFAMHLQSFFFVLMIPATIAEWICEVELQRFAFLGLLIYGYIAARKFYKRKRLSTFLRLIASGILHSVLSLFILIAFFLILVKSYAI